MNSDKVEVCILNYKHWLNDIAGITNDTPSINSDTAQTQTVYDNWCQFTGNPKKLTKSQFDALYESDLIDEFKYSNYNKLTGNPQSLSEEEFNTLKKSKQIRLFKKDRHQ